MITIDEAIASERNQHEFSDYNNYHEQLAEWLELLKWYEQGMEDIPSESGVLPKDVYHAGYNKALDDFVKAIVDRGLSANDDKYCITHYDNYLKVIKELAEQLKAGVENGC